MLCLQNLFPVCVFHQLTALFISIWFVFFFAVKVNNHLQLHLWRCGVIVVRKTATPFPACLTLLRKCRPGFPKLTEPHTETNQNVREVARDDRSIFGDGRGNQLLAHRTANEPKKKERNDVICYCILCLCLFKLCGCCENLDSGHGVLFMRRLLFSP